MSTLSVYTLTPVLCVDSYVSREYTLTLAPYPDILKLTPVVSFDTCTTGYYTTINIPGILGFRRKTSFLEIIAIPIA